MKLVLLTLATAAVANAVDPKILSAMKDFYTSTNGDHWKNNSGWVRSLRHDSSNTHRPTILLSPSALLPPPSHPKQEFGGLAGFAGFTVIISPLPQRSIPPTSPHVAPPLCHWATLSYRRPTAFRIPARPSLAHSFSFSCSHCRLLTSPPIHPTPLALAPLHTRSLRSLQSGDDYCKFVGVRCEPYTSGELVTELILQVRSLHLPHANPASSPLHDDVVPRAPPKCLVFQPLLATVYMMIPDDPNAASPRPLPGPGLPRLAPGVAPKRLV